MADQSQVIAVAAGLLSLGCRRGATQILFNAALQRQAAEQGDFSEWTPSGPVPLRRKPAEQPDPANDHVAPSQKPASPLA